MPHSWLATPLGDLTIFVDDNAVVALEWGRAVDAAPTPLLQEAIDQLRRYFEGSGTSFDLPLCPAGTPFQRRVWARLAEIPYGTTCTYGALAGELHTSPRALAGACAANPIPIVVPCHRVVAVAGRLGGYSGGDGPSTKRALLRLEGAEITCLAAEPMF